MGMTKLTSSEFLSLDEIIILIWLYCSIKILLLFFLFILIIVLYISSIELYEDNNWLFLKSIK